jgi:hypothetical protein
VSFAVTGIAFPLASTALVTRVLTLAFGVASLTLIVSKEPLVSVLTSIPIAPLTTFSASA